MVWWFTQIVFSNRGNDCLLWLGKHLFNRLIKTPDWLDGCLGSISMYSELNSLKGGPRVFPNNSLVID